jgi:hypothetical protein
MLRYVCTVPLHYPYLSQDFPLLVPFQDVSYKCASIDFKTYSYVNSFLIFPPNTFLRLFYQQLFLMSISRFPSSPPSPDDFITFSTRYFSRLPHQIPFLDSFTRYFSSRPFPGSFPHLLHQVTFIIFSTRYLSSPLLPYTFQHVNFQIYFLASLTR